MSNMTGEGRSFLSWKHLCQLEEAAIQNIDFGQLLATVDLVELESAVLIHKHDPDSAIFWINDPVLPDAGLLVEPKFYELVVTLRRWGEDLHNHVRCPLAAILVQFVVVANNGDVR